MKLVLEHDARRFAKDNPPAPIGMSVGRVYDLKTYALRGERIHYHIPGFIEVKRQVITTRVRVKPAFLNVNYCPFCGKEHPLVEKTGD